MLGKLIDIVGTIISWTAAFTIFAAINLLFSLFTVPGVVAVIILYIVIGG